MSDSVPPLPSCKVLENEQLEQLIGLSYEMQPVAGEAFFHNFRVQGSEHYGFVSEGPRPMSWIVQNLKSQEQFLVLITGEYQDIAKSEPWTGTEAYEAKMLAEATKRAEEQKAAQDELAVQKAAAMALAPKSTELFPKLEALGHRRDDFLRLFEADPRVVLSLAVSETGEAQSLSFTSMAGEEVKHMQAEDALPSTMWAALAAATGAPAHCISVIMPSGVAKGPPVGPCSLQQLLEGTEDSWPEATLTAKANLCIAETSHDKPKEVIKWLRVEAGVSLSAALRTQAFEMTERMLRDSAWTLGDLLDTPIKAAYKSEEVRSRDCWWIDHEFKAVVLGEPHDGVVLLQHSVNKDMS